MKKLKSNKGISITDLIVAMLIFMMFAGIVGNLFYEIAYNNVEIKANEIAAEYAIKIAEDIDKENYNNINNEHFENAKEKYSMQSNFDAEIEVKKYKEEENYKDIIKIVNIKITYKIFNKSKEYQIEKLKVKEM